MRNRRNPFLLLVVGAIASLVAGIPAFAQTTMKLCVPIPAQPGSSAGCQDVTTAFPLPITGAAGGGSSSPLNVSSTPASRTLVSLDAKTVTTGGVAVTALVAGNRTAGGWLQNPSSATINLCINEIGTATGTTSSGDTTCIVAGQGYVLTPAAGAVSVVSSDSAHPFSGYGLK